MPEGHTCLCWRRRSEPCGALHQEGRGGVSRAWDGCDLRIEVEDFPAFIVIDDKGNDISTCSMASRAWLFIVSRRLLAAPFAVALS
jgi:hypothetical protein